MKPTPAAALEVPEPELLLQLLVVALDPPAQLVETLAEAEWLFPVAAIWNDRLGPALTQSSRNSALS